MKTPRVRFKTIQEESKRGREQGGMNKDTRGKVKYKERRKDRERK